MSRSRQRTCGGKRRYRDDREAQRVLRLLAQRSERGKVPIRYYWCATCNGYHLSSKPQRGAA